MVNGAKKRREYLRRRLTALISIVLWGAVAVFFLLALILTVCAWRFPSPDGYKMSVGAVLFDFVVFGLVLAYAFNAWRETRKKAAAIPYVPPVREQIQLSGLPAENVLVRGSHPPAAEPTELLRAAQAGTTLPAEELLRPHAMQPEEDLQQIGTGRP